MHKRLGLWLCCLGLLLLAANGFAHELILPKAAGTPAEAATCDGACCATAACATAGDAACPVTGETCTCAPTDETPQSPLPATTPLKQLKIFSFDAPFILIPRAFGLRLDVPRLVSVPRVYKVRLHMLNRSILC